MFLMFTALLYGQSEKRRFRAGLIAGLNFAELEGDGLTDYIGLNAGIFGSANLSDHWQVSMELLFSQNGEYIRPAYYPPIAYGAIWLQHVEVPVHIDLLVDPNKNNDHKDWQFSIGLAYAQLLGFDVENAEGVEVNDQIEYERVTNFLAQAGTTYFFLPKLGLNLRASLPIRDRLDWTVATRLIWRIN